MVADPLADPFGQPGLGARTGEKPAIAPENLVDAIAGQLDERPVDADDRIVGQAGVGNDRGDRAGLDQACHPYRGLRALTAEITCVSGRCFAGDAGFHNAEVIDTRSELQSGYPVGLPFGCRFAESDHAIPIA